MFAQEGNRVAQAQRNNNHSQMVPGRNKVLHIKILCFECQRNGHYAEQCLGQKGTQLAQIRAIITQDSAGISSSWVLLDTCSTNSAMNNLDLIDCVKDCSANEVLTISMNSAQMIFLKKGFQTFPHGCTF